MTSNDKWAREMAGQLLNSDDRAIEGTAFALASLEQAIAAFGQEAIERGKREQAISEMEAEVAAIPADEQEAMKARARPLAALKADVARTRSEERWRCFHCDEVFTDSEAARAHFGADETTNTACQIDIDAVRKMEEELARYRAEDSDADREFHRIIADHATALRHEEERGYERGLADARTEERALATEELKKLQEERDLLEEDCKRKFQQVLNETARAEAAEAKLARLRNPDEAMVEAVAAALLPANSIKFEGQPLHLQMSYRNAARAVLRAIAATLDEKEG